MLKFYHKVMKLANILFYFSTQDWRFSDQSVRNMWDTLSEQDKAVFPFSIADMNWEYLAETFLVGKRHLVASCGAFVVGGRHLVVTSWTYFMIWKTFYNVPKSDV